VVAVVIPFRAGGKSRLPAELRRGLALAMLGDVVEAARSSVSEVRIVTDDREAMLVAGDLGADVVVDPGGGQGAAVTAGLAGLEGQCLVVNADLPCVSRASLVDLAARGAAHVPARDGTTNALALPSPEEFEPLYGAGSAARFAATGLAVAAIAELECDVDTLGDLELLSLPVGRRTTLVLHRHDLARAGLP
jgi:2-phospho-L-lactate/phosphoenolpyruvate guanylyltransferase